MDRQQYAKQLNRFKIMNRKTVKISFVSVIVIIAGVVYFTMSEYRRKHKDIADIPESFSLNSNEIINSFSTNEKSAYKMYLDKVMSVRGTVKSIYRDVGGACTIVLGNDTSMSSVRCSLDSNHTDGIALIKPGADISIKGICTGYNADELLGSDVVLNRCAIKN